MTNEDGLIIIGAGGHAKVVLSTALANSKHILGFVDDASHGAMSDYPLLGDLEYLIKLHSSLTVIAIGNNATRKNIAEKFANHCQWQTLIHPSAIVHPSAQIGAGSVIFAGAIIQPDVIIGQHCIVNTGTTIDHDCVLSDYVHLAPGVHLAGNVTIGEGSLLGIGSVALPNIQIAEWIVAGAGAVIVTHIKAHKKIVGIPAKEISLC